MRVINVAKRCYNVSLGLHVSGRSSLVFSHQVLRDYSTVTAAVESSEMTPKPFSEIPGLKGWPVLGKLPHIIQDLKSGRAREEMMFHKLQEKFGPIYKLRGLGNEWQLVVSTPAGIAAMFRAEGKIPQRGVEANMMWIYRKMKKPYPMFFAGGEEWKRIRSAGNKQILPRRVANFVQPLNEIADEFLAYLDEQQDENGYIRDIRDETTKWAFQGVSYFVYGEKTDVYGDDPKQTKFMKIGLEFIDNLAKIASALPFYRLFPTKLYKKYVSIVEEMHHIGKQIIDRKYVQLKVDIENGTVDDSKAVGLLDQWLIEGKYTEEEAISQSCDMLSAGIDTTTNSSTFLLYELAKNPQLQERVYNEVQSVMGDKPHPSWDDLQKMILIRNSVKEVMRMYIPTIVPRKIMEDTVIEGYLVPAGTTVIANIVSSSLDSSIYEDPFTFNPDRWSKNSGSRDDRFATVPFGFGPRMCYGRRLAELEMYILVMKMISKYHLTTNISSLKLTRKTITKPKEAVPLKLTERR